MTPILTSGFPNGFTLEFVNQLNKVIKPESSFVFIASEFENIYERTDWYCAHFVKMFTEHGIYFNSVKVIDHRVTKGKAQEIVENADVLWLAGGDTPTQFGYLMAYELNPIIKNHQGVVIGMSAGSINMCKTAICTLTCEHDEQKIYKGIGLVDFSVEPHFDKNNVTLELITLSESYPMYGICDEGAILCEGDKRIFVGEVYLIDKGRVTLVKN